MKNGKKLKIMEKGGFSGVEITVAILILMIFISLINVLFVNIYLSYTDSRRNSEATAYATQIMEQVEKMYYNEVTNQNLAQKALEMNIPNGYGVQIQVDKYNAEDTTKEDLVKNVIITINYKVGKQEKSVSLETIKAKEILITPNKPILNTGMVPVKYVITDRMTHKGYWQITAEDDPTWYSYENKKWATVMMQENLTVEGDIYVTQENMKNLIGKKVKTYGQMLVWVPRFAYRSLAEGVNVADVQNDIEFLYNITNNYVDESGSMQDIASKEGYVAHAAFGTEEIGLWLETYDYTAENAKNYLANLTTEELQNNLLGAVTYLTYSKYGNIINIIKDRTW